MDFPTAEVAFLSEACRTLLPSTAIVSSWRELKLEGSVLMVREIRLNVLPAEFDMDSSAEKVCRLERRSAAEDKLRGLGDEARQAFRMYSYAAFTYVWPRRGCLLPEAMGRLLRHLIAPAPRGPDPIRCDRPRHFARPPACLTARREPAGIPRRRIRSGSRYWKNGSVNTASASRQRRSAASPEPACRRARPRMTRARAWPGR